jgi:hypothetical protein
MAKNVRAFLQETLGDSVATDDIPSDVTVGTSTVTLVNSNSRRIKVRLSNFGGATVAVERDSSVTATTGIPISPGETLELDAQEDYELCTKQLIGISAFAGNAVHIVETVLLGDAEPRQPA